MSRTAKRVTIDFLKQKIDALIRHKDDHGEYVDDCPLRDAIDKDLKIKFDFENFYYGQYADRDPLVGYCTLGNGLTLLGCSAGGDWEYPVWFCVYWDGRKLRAYVPTAGNPFNSKTKTAYGNDDEADRKDMLKRWPQLRKLEEEQDRAVESGDVERNYDLILADLMERIEVKD